MKNEKFTAERIKEQYMVKSDRKVEKLVALDKKVKKPAKIFALTFGIIASLILGVGMCFGLKVFAVTTPVFIAGIATGVLGLLLVSINYPIYLKILSSRKKKYSSEIISLSDEIINKV